MFNKNMEFKWLKNNRIYLDEDTQLMIKASEGDKKAYALLYNKYFPIVTRFVSSRNGQLRDREDISQEVFIRIWNNRKSYQPNSTFKTFVFTYAKNVTHELQQHLPAVANHFEMMVESSDPETAVQHKELTLIIERAKSKLSEKQLQALEFTLYSNISVDKAAKLAGCSSSVFRRRVCDAKKRLSTLLKHIQQY